MNSTVAKCVFGPSGIVAKVKGGSTTYLHQDHLGSARLVTDLNGVSIFDRNYRPSAQNNPAAGFTTNTCECGVSFNRLLETKA